MNEQLKWSESSKVEGIKPQPEQPKDELGWAVSPSESLNHNLKKPAPAPPKSHPTGSVVACGKMWAN